MNDPFRQASWNTDQALICVASEGADVESIVAASDPRPRSAVTPIRQADRLAWLMYPLERGSAVAIEDRLLEYLWSGQLQVRDDSGLIEPAWFDGAYIEIDVGLRTYFQRVARDPSDITETAEGSRLKTYAIEERQPRFGPGQLRDVLIGSNHASREANRTGLPGKPSSAGCRSRALAARRARTVKGLRLQRKLRRWKGGLKREHKGTSPKSEGHKNRLSQLFESGGRPK